MTGEDENRSARLRRSHRQKTASLPCALQAKDVPELPLVHGGSQEIELALDAAQVAATRGNLTCRLGLRL
jgi:hypothetical protein